VKNDTIHAIDERVEIKDVEKLSIVFENIITTW